MISEHDELLIGELPQHPAWSGLMEIADERRKQKFDHFASKLMRGEEVTPEEVAYERGYFDGVKYVFREVDRLKRIRSEIIG